MGYKRKRTYGKGYKRGGSHAGGGRRTGGSRRIGRTKSRYKKRAYTKSVRKSTKKVASRSKGSSSSKFRAAVIRAIASTNTYVNTETQRVSWNYGTKCSGFQYAVSTGAWGASYWPVDIASDVVALARLQIPLPSGIMSPGNPFEVYLVRQKLVQTITNCYQIPCFGRWYCFTSRYDGLTEDPVSAYSLERTFLQGATGVGSTTALESGLIGSTPYNFRAVCQSYKIRSMSKVFRLEPGVARRFSYTQKKFLHITPRIIDLSAIKQTKFFMFEFWGPPINDSTTPTHLNTAAGVVDIFTTYSTDYESRPIPNTYKDFYSGAQAITTPSVFVNSTDVVTTTPTVS